MHVLLLLAGIGVLAGTILDVLATTLSPGTREGLVTRTFGRFVWNRAVRLAGRDGGSRLLVVVGPVLLAVAVLGWMGGLLLGWFLVFLAGDPSIVVAATGAPVDAWDVLYYAGYTIFTLGNGGYAPVGAGWQVATILATGNGLLMATLAITYMVPVVTAVTQRRQVAAMASGLGTTVPGVLRTATAGEPWVFEKLLLDLSSQVVLTAERHLAYPLIHFFFSADRSTAFAPTVAAVDEAVGILLADTRGPWRANPVALTSFRRSVERLLDAVDSPDLVAEAPPRPPLPADVQAVVGLPEAVARDEHRRRLASYVEDSGWGWGEVVGDADELSLAALEGQPAGASVR